MTVPIPARCAHLPTVGGLVKPWGNVHLADGGVDFRSHHGARHIRCWHEGLCQVCGERLTTPAVLFGGPDELRQLVFTEPPMHPECAVYTSRACPMVNGARTHFADRPEVSQGRRGEVCPTPGCDCGGWVKHAPVSTKAGKPAHAWYAVYVSTFMPAWRPDMSFLGGIVYPEHVGVVRLVSEPGAGRCWRKVPDALDGYVAPTTEIRPTP